ncbi:hypothetical protein AKO1_014303 [Acrasis kona]|uniref:IBR domain-containing protein n=1 Tax=Acrasis kona TaxID=1008807 RepID=A0AAW2Z0L6_9EUKA
MEIFEIDELEDRPLPRNDDIDLAEFETGEDDGPHDFDGIPIEEVETADVFTLASEDKYITAGECKECKKENHFPCTCDEVLRWMEIINNEPELIEQPCLKCGKIYKKDTGSDHIVCDCGNEFCFVCKKFWDGHSHFDLLDKNKENCLHVLAGLYKSNKLSQELSRQTLDHGMAHALFIVSKSMVTSYQFLKYSAACAYFHQDNKNLLNNSRRFEHYVRLLQESLDSFVLDLESLQTNHEKLIECYEDITD